MLVYEYSVETLLYLNQENLREVQPKKLEQSCLQELSPHKNFNILEFLVSSAGFTSNYEKFKKKKIFLFQFCI